MNLKKVITRFPPSPTGRLQLGNARTALFNFLFAKHNKGEFLFRLEDTDKERSKKEYETDMIDALLWLGITYDNKEIWRQSERGDIYKKYLKKIIDNGNAYNSKETPEEVGERSEVIRFKNPNKKIKFTDLIRGEISFDTSELGDFVIAKSLDEPLYHLAVVIDDAEMGVTHIIRGEDGISNTPRQILLQEAFGFERPEYAHLPLILAPDRSKLSKRHGAIPVNEYRDKGFLPDALVNYLALLGWNSGTDKEIFTLEELIEKFDLSKVQKGGAIFNEEKLRWFNKEYMKKLGGAEQLFPHIPSELTEGKNKIQLNALARMLFERISVVSDIPNELKQGEFDYLLRAPAIQSKMLSWKEQSFADVGKHLEAVAKIIKELSDEDFTADEIKAVILPYAEEAGKGNTLWPFRVALSGKEKSPDPFTLASIIGRNETLSRLTTALNMLK